MHFFYVAFRITTYLDSYCTIQTNAPLYCDHDDVLLLQVILFEQTLKHCLRGILKHTSIVHCAIIL
jgi:hypothetical protein